MATTTVTPFVNSSSPLDVDAYIWATNVTPLASVNYVVITIACYLALIFGLQAWMKDRKPFELKGAARVHNFILCVWSGAMTVSCVFYVVQFYLDGYTVTDLFCDNVQGKPLGNMMRGRLGVVAWSYFASKTYELLDTVLRVLKKKELTLLHVYHHCIVMYLVYTWNIGNFSLQWWAIMMNTAVHVVMYYYYFVASIKKGYKPWWRVWITTFQLFQFVTVFINIFVWFAISLENPRWTSSFPFIAYDASKCSGDLWVVVFSQTVNVSFLFLFGQFFVANYLAKRKKKSADNAKKES